MNAYRSHFGGHAGSVLSLDRFRQLLLFASTGCAIAMRFVLLADCKHGFESSVGNINAAHGDEPWTGEPEARRLSRLVCHGIFDGPLLQSPISQ
jgi:hypothetical protein